MALSVVKKLYLGELNPTTLSLQMADLSLFYPEGIIEDVWVKVDKFIFLVDFLALYMEEDKATSLILGVTPRFPVRPNWRIRTQFRDARPYTGTLYLFFFKVELVPVGMAHIL